MSHSGTIKKLFESKGFGFITQDDGNDDVFFHVKENRDLEGCKEGDAVSFDCEWDHRKSKYRCTNVCLKGGGGDGGGGGGNAREKDKRRWNQTSLGSRLKRWEKRNPKQQAYHEAKLRVMDACLHLEIE